MFGFAVAVEILMLTFFGLNIRNLMCPDNKPEKEYVVDYNRCVFQLAF